MTAKCSYIFPVPVLERDGAELITPDVVSKCMEHLQDRGDMPFYSPCISTVRRGDNVLEFPGFENIKQFVVESISTYCDFARIDKNGMYISGAWVNLYEPHGYQDLHVHQDSVLSGVLYIEAHGRKDFIVQAPWHFFQPSYARLSETTINNCHNLEYESHPGRCYIFPSHLMHRTLPTHRRRISLAFNVRYGDR